MNVHVSDRAPRETKRERLTFANAYKADRHYSIQLRKISRHIEDIVRVFHPFGMEDIMGVTKALNDYSVAIRPWARATARRMLVDVMRRNEHAWRSLSNQMGFELKRQLDDSDWGRMLQSEMARQVDLITSLPTDAATRIHKLAIGELYEVDRGAGIMKEIMRSGAVSKSRAELIARTEVGRASSEMVKARAAEFESDGYIWRNANDRDVRPLHRTHSRGGIADKFYRWDDPPVSGENGERSLPGGIYNCRCYAEPVIPSEFLG